MRAALFAALLALCAVAPIFARREFAENEIEERSSSYESAEDDDRRERKLALDARSFSLGAYRQSSRTPSQDAERLQGDKLVEFVNQRQNLWRANPNHKFAHATEEQKLALMGVLNTRNSIKARRSRAKTHSLNIELPDSFDARERWGAQCPSVSLIRDQSSCGSCWSFGAVEAMSDRLCIASGGKLSGVTLSARDLLSCCKSCGFGCNGGEPFAAWQYWHEHGIVTGSNYTANQGCMPYSFPPCEHHSTRTHFPACPAKLYHTPTCERSCQSGYSVEYEADKYYGKEPYAVAEDEEAIKKELFVNGPLEVTLEVYEDFLAYSEGVYVHQGGKLDGGHAVRLVGWGRDPGNVPYWLVANSWNTDWGMSGFFKILRGANECGIEGGVVGGLADLKRSPHPRSHNADENDNHEHRRHHQHRRQHNRRNDDDEDEQPRHQHHHTRRHAD